MKIKLNNVRLSFPQLAKPKAINDGSPKYGASFLLNKEQDKSQIDELRKAIKQVAQEKWPSKIPASVKYCVHDGSEKDYDGYGPEIVFISTTSTMAPVCVDQRVTPMDPNKLYAGCYVNASIRLWAQDNQYGKRVNAQLLAVQFAAEGESFGAGPVDPNEEFAPVGGSTAADAGTATEEEDNIPI